jgi:hypothetical protein
MRSGRRPRTRCRLAILVRPWTRRVPRWVRWLPRPGWGIVAAIVLFYLLLAVLSAPGRRRTGPTALPFMVYEQNGSLVVAFSLADPNWSVAESLGTTPSSRVFSVNVLRPRASPRSRPGHSSSGRQTRISAYVFPGMAPASAKDLAEIQEALYQWSLNTGHVGMISDPHMDWHISWPGVAFNALLLLLVVTVPLSIVRFVYEARAAARERVVDRTAAARRVSEVRVLDRGIATSESCPECGEFIPRDAIDGGDRCGRVENSRARTHERARNQTSLAASRHGSRAGSGRRAGHGLCWWGCCTFAGDLWCIAGRESWRSSVTGRLVHTVLFGRMGTVLLRHDQALVILPSTPDLRRSKRAELGRNVEIA